jgi:hypothetical protein
MAWIYQQHLKQEFTRINVKKNNLQSRIVFCTIQTTHQTQEYIILDMDSFRNIYFCFSKNQLGKGIVFHQNGRVTSNYSLNSYLLHDPKN